MHQATPQRFNNQLAQSAAWACALLLAAVVSPAWAQVKGSAVDIDRVPTPALEAHCRSIPDHAHVSGEVDGG